AQAEWIVRVVESPPAALADDERHQAVDGVGAVRKMNPELREFESRGKVRPVARGLHDLPGPIDILYWLGGNGHTLGLARGERDQYDGNNYLFHISRGDFVAAPAIWRSPSGEWARD